MSRDYDVPHVESTGDWPQAIGLRNTMLLRTLTAGISYFAVVFAAGFVLGTLRLTLLAPVLGGLLAVLVELPFMLIISWFASHRITVIVSVPQRRTARIGMGAIAFALLMVAELALGLSVFQRTVREFFEAFATLEGVFGLVGQIAFALIPLAQTRKVAGSAT